jgi:phosphatidylglycerol:prolipoprotein diacylglycerol transferase
VYPVLFTIPIPAIPVILPQGGSIPVFTYGTSIALGFLLTYFYICALARRRGIDEEHITDLYLVIILTSILGARSNYVLTHWHEFAADPRDVYRVWQGGMVYLGGFLGAMFGGMGYLWIRRLPWGPYYDMFAPAVPFACALGRVGCLMNGCCYGVPTDAWCGMAFPRVPQPRHPTQIYELVILLAISAGLHAYYMRNRVPGMAMVWLGYLYSIERFGIESLRDESMYEHYLFGTTLAQTTCLIVLALIAACHVVLRRRGTPGPSPAEMATAPQAPPPAPPPPSAPPR